MPEGFSIGPLLILTRPLAVILSLLLAVWVSKLIAGRRGLDSQWSQRVAEGCAWSGIIGARLGFVLMTWSAFRATPWTAFYFWQPGYLPYSGLLFGAAYALWRIGKRPVNERRSYLRVLGGGYAVGAVLAIAVLGTMNMFTGSQVLRSGDRVPDFTLVNLSGDTVRFSDLEGQAVVLNFWATWCPPCRREMPLLDAIQREYKSRGLSIVGIDVGEDPNAVRRYVESIGVTYPIWLDAPNRQTGIDSTQSIHGRFGGVGLPTTIFVDPEGIVRDRHLGELNRAILQTQAEELLGQ
ncbi:MAG: TlpA disulfide reductase family protein [Gammaproteobacteria bacterium]|nr:TlpA disulfide reductase family protein [Gammaproteobacteria bacterium]